MQEASVLLVNGGGLQYTQEQIINVAKFSSDDLIQIGNCRQEHNRIGFGYQLAFVRLLNRFPTQVPFEVMNDILVYVSIQLGIPSDRIDAYNQRQPTISDHQETIRSYLGLIRFADADQEQLVTFMFEEACRSETTRAILARTKQFLTEQSILQPSDDTLQRLIARSREQAKEYIYKRIAGLLEKFSIEELESLISTEDTRVSPFQVLKEPPGRPSPGAMLKLIERLDTIQSFGVMDIDILWLNNNLQRALTRYAKQCTATRLRRLEPNRKHAVLVCFLWQSYLDNIDSMVDMYDKLINKVYKHAQADVDDHHKKNRKQIRESLFTFKDLAALILDDAVDDVCLRQELLKKN